MSRMRPGWSGAHGLATPPSWDERVKCGKLTCPPQGVYGVWQASQRRGYAMDVLLASFKETAAGRSRMRGAVRKNRSAAPLGTAGVRNGPRLEAGGGSMPTTLRYGLMIGAAIAIVDWIIGTIARAFAPDDPITAALAGADLGLNIVLFALAGALGYRSSGTIRSGAEAAVIAGLLAGAIAAVRQMVDPVVGQPTASVSDVIGLLALNVALGGVIGIAGAWLARSRSRQ
jgi:hypothetical protein